MILDGNGTPVWYKRPSGSALNVTPLGHNTVAFMPTFAVAFGTDINGAYDVDNLETQQTTHVQAVGVPTDLHEFRRLPNGDTLLLSYPLKRHVDLTGLQATPTPGNDETIADCEIQEVTPQGNAVFTWKASDHIDPVTETTFGNATNMGGENVYDVFHCNSIDANAAGDILVSARHLNAVFQIRPSDGKIVWKMGGKPVNKDGAQIITITNYSGTSTGLQHDARYMPGNHVSLFDDQTFQGRRKRSSSRSTSTRAPRSRSSSSRRRTRSRASRPGASGVTPTATASWAGGHQLQRHERPAVQRSGRGRQNDVLRRPVHDRRRRLPRRQGTDEPIRPQRPARDGGSVGVSRDRDTSPGTTSRQCEHDKGQTNTCALM